MISSTKVPYAGDPESPVVFIGEAPGNKEREERQPFVGESGNLLTSVLLRNGLARENVYLTNLCKYQPPGNKFDALLNTKELAEGLQELSEYFKSRKTRPNLIVPLGNWPLTYITGIRKGGITSWRGSILRSDFPGAEGIKVIPAFHPAYVLRTRSEYPVFDLDIKRIHSDSEFPELRLPEREFIILDESNYDKLGYYTDLLLSSGEFSVDIETFGPHIACVGFSPRPNLGICIVWSHNPMVRHFVSRILASPVPKTFHFGTFDVNFLALHDIEVNNFTWDTLLAQHVMWPELPRALAFLTSIYTREPFYKHEGRVVLADEKSWTDKTDHQRLWRYNIKDCCCTQEIKEMQVKEIKEGPKEWKEFFDYEMSMLPVAHEIMRNGLLVDFKRFTQLQSQVLRNVERIETGVQALLMGFPVNVKSPKQVQNLLYNIWNLPVRKGKTGQPTSDEDALIALLAMCKEKLDFMTQPDAKARWMQRFYVIQNIIKLRGLHKLKSSYLNEKIINPTDGRIRAVYKVGGTETGRWSAEGYLDGTGLNPQTFPREAIEVEI